jgi:sugar lactone lactonase YvrE
MSSLEGRHAAASPANVASGWRLERLTPPSRLFGANGLRTGPDGRIYVAQVSGSQIAAIDVSSGAIETISPMGGDIVGPDDLVFDDRGNLYATEITEGRVSVRAPNGLTRVLNGDIPGANPITFHQGRLYAGECRPGARIMELDLNSGAQRVIASDIPMANAMEVGPDGKLYFPVMGVNEIWRVALGGGAPEKVAGDLGVPDSVKFDSRGFIISTQVASGQVLRIDPQNGDRTVLASIAPGLDNCTFVGGRLFVSSISGQINEILPDGQLKSLVPDGFNWPLGIAMGADGQLYLADGAYTYTLRPGGKPQVAGMLFTPGIPGYIRGIASSAPGEVVVTTAMGHVARWRPAKQESEFLAEGYDQLMGVALAPSGAIVFAEMAGGRVMSVAGGKAETLGSSLNKPMGVAIGDDGAVYVSEAGAGRIVAAAGGRVETIVDGLKAPQGILARGGVLYIVDADAKELVAYDLSAKKRTTIASALPVGAPAGVTPKFLKAIPPLSGPMGPFAGITAGSDGTLYVSADAEGSVLAFTPSGMA